MRDLLERSAHQLCLPHPLSASHTTSVSVGVLTDVCGVADAAWTIDPKQAHWLLPGLSPNSFAGKAVHLGFLSLSIWKGSEEPSSARGVISHLRAL